MQEKKVTVNENISQESGFRIAPNWPKLLQMGKMTMTSKFFKIFWNYFVSLVTFSYWSKFHVNIVTGYGIMTSFLDKIFIGNTEIENTPVWVLPSILRLGQVRDTKPDMNVSTKMFLNASKCLGYSFFLFLSCFRFWVIKGIPIGEGEGGKSSPPPD